ncbi:acyl carrier protein [Streptomyces sp. NPDC050433]|uniref:acyl carrier protein n=1 Tax=Streptomyces sp. NPDC050433 TaxID=3365615 RepID=UPI003788BC4A
MEQTEQIRRFIEEHFLIEFGVDVTPQSDLFKAGVIDSFGYVQLMEFLEREFSLKLTGEEILLNVLVSLEAIDAFVSRQMVVRLPEQEGCAPCAD